MRRYRFRFSKRYASRARRLHWRDIKRARDRGDLSRARYVGARTGAWDVYYRGPDAKPFPQYVTVCDVYGLVSQTDEATAAALVDAGGFLVEGPR